MKSIDFDIHELFEFKEGNINLHGRRLVLHSIHAFAQFRHDLISTIGIDHARGILTRYGYFWGEADAAAMKRIFKWNDVQEWMLAWPRLLSLEGAVRTQVKSFSMDISRNLFSMEIVWHDSAEAIEHSSELGKSSNPVCWILTGYASGYTSFVMNKNIYFTENSCMACGAKTCQATGKDEITWGEEIKPFLIYFNSSDIKGKIQTLSDELRKKTAELEREKRILANSGMQSPSEFVEVRSAVFQRVVDLARKVAPYDTSVLITGESGTGKEVLARFIKKNSMRQNECFLTVNCGALPETLLESQLFGHKAGSFTGASHDHIGFFEQANNGTIFLDEIGDISPDLQIKLLRIIQNREFIKVGESRSRKTNVRIISATNQDLQKLVAAGKFREDLYYRLRVVEIKIPPLRERPEDIIPLARQFVKLFSKKLKIPGLHLDSTVIDHLQNYSWPGNIRELENAIEHSSVFSRDGQILPNCLPTIITQSDSLPTSAGFSENLESMENAHILKILKSSGGNKLKTASLLGISPATLWRKLKKIQKTMGSGQH
ncbi:MAG: sigma-54-dependent Fis family transcriptional regulator [Candidatus Aureabacteria bacterium]|nr:sigma-54-dependent Fis family transcriptional regulator [Candidatus Auribacterota bacterium]